VIARQEGRGRRYYGGVLALIGRDAEGRSSLDSPILIRTAEIAADGSVRVAAGATLVRGSTPESELAETRAKAAGIVAALMSDPVPEPDAAPGGVRMQPGLGADPEILAVLERRNDTLARFWLQEQHRANRPVTSGGPSAVDRSRGRITVINAEDDFTGMLAQLLATLGFEVEVQPWTRISEYESEHEQAAEIVVLGPGPGDPNDLSDPRIAALHRLARARLAAKAPVFGVCLGHQILGATLGLTVQRLPRPDQGRQTGITLFGVPHRVGFYNSYVVRAPQFPIPGLAFSLDENRRRVHAFRGDQVGGLQFHPESVLTTAGLDILGGELDRLRTIARPRE
jgi:phenazine biosynthesis protein phzE